MGYSVTLRRFWMSAVLAVVCSTIATAQVSINTSPTPIGSGARAAGMANAFTAVADDATAASWNPAGLVQLERPELSIVGAYTSINERFMAEGHREVDRDVSSNWAELNYLSLTYPLPFTVGGRNATVSLSYQRRYGFDREVDLDFDTYGRAFGGGRSVDSISMVDLDWYQTGELGVISPAIAFELTNRLSVGVAYNLWRDTPFGKNEWKRKTTAMTTAIVAGTPSFGFFEEERRYENVEGENFTIGLLWNPTEKWRFGLRYDTAFDADADYTRETFQWLTLPFGAALAPFPAATFSPFEREKGKRTIHFPDSWSLGVAYQANDRLLLALDIVHSSWDEFGIDDGRFNRISLVDGSNRKLPFFRESIDDTYTVRLGAEYVFIPKEPEEELDYLWSLRGGLFYDPQPSTGDPDDYYGAALGVGVLWKQRVNLDAAYQIRYGDDVGRAFIKGVHGFKEDVLQHRFVLSTVIYF